MAVLEHIGETQDLRFRQSESERNFDYKPVPLVKIPVQKRVGCQPKHRKCRKEQR
jgi:hypothetical protein